MTAKLLLLSVWSLFLGYSDKDVDDLHGELYSLMDTDPEKALVVADSALAMAENLSYEWGVANTYYIKAYIYDEKNELDEALLYYLRASKVLEGSSEEKFIKNRLAIIVNIGAILRKNNNYDDAIDFYIEALSISDEEKYAKVRLQLLFNLAFALQDQGDLPGAVEYLDQTARLATKIGNNRLLLKSWNILGLVNSNNEDYGRARQFYDKIIAHPSADEEAIAKAKHNKANTYFYEDSFETAKSLYEEVLVIKRKLETPDLLFKTLKSLSNLHTDLSEFETALTYASEAEGLYPQIFHEPESFELFHTLRTISYNLDDYEQANHYSNRYAEEVSHYYEQQKAIIELKDQFKTDLILAGFQQELAAKVRTDMLWKWIYAISFVSISVISIMYIRRVMMRRVVEQAIAQLKH